MIHPTNVIHGVEYFIGTRDEAGWGYAFWSGIGLVILMPYQSWRRHNCHTRRCLRIGRHQLRNGDLLCHRCAGKPRHMLRLPHVHLTHR